MSKRPVTLEGRIGYHVRHCAMQRAFPYYSTFMAFVLRRRAQTGRDTTAQLLVRNLCVRRHICKYLSRDDLCSGVSLCNR